MSSKIALKNLQDQEFSINHLDGAGAIAINSNDIVTKTVTSVTDNSIARYDGTTGKLQNSGVFIDDSNIITSGGLILPNSAIVGTTTLDWYEEGTFTPDISGFSTVGVGTYTTQYGKYTRIGNVVTFTAYLTWTAHTGTGGMRVSGLPFNSANIASNVYSFPVALDSITYTGTHIYVYLTTGQNYCGVYQTSTNTGTTGVPIDTAGTISISGSYICA